MSSSILDLSILDDSSEDEDEAILKAYVGRVVTCPKKASTSRVSPPRSPPSLTQSSLETENEKAAAQPEEPTLTKEEIEAKGEFTVLRVSVQRVLERYLSHKTLPSFRFSCHQTIAQETTRDLKLHAVQRVKSLDNLGWRRTNKASEFYFAEAKGTHTYFYPCVRLPEEEAYLMFKNTSKNQKKIGIQYLGWTWKEAASCYEVVGTTFVQSK